MFFIPFLFSFLFFKQHGVDVTYEMVAQIYAPRMNWIISIIFSIIYAY